MFTSREIFDIAIRLEQNSENLYRKAAKHITDEALKATLLWLADEEKSHQGRFVEMKNSIKAGSEDLWAEQLSLSILQGALEHRAFSLEEVELTSIQDEKELLKIAIEFEEDRITFYQIVGFFVTDSNSMKTIEEIIEQERKSVHLFLKRQRALE